MKNKLLQLTAVLFMVGSTSVWAVPIVSVDMDPGTAGIQSAFTLGLGQMLTIDVVIAGVVAPGLNGFEFDVMFDPTILAPTSVVSGGFLLAPTFTVQIVLGALVVEFAEVTLSPLGATGGGVLATIVFDTIGAGVSSLDLKNVILAAPFGIEITPVTLVDGSVTVTSVPEPGTLALLGIGLLGLALGRRKQAA